MNNQMDIGVILGFIVLIGFLFILSRVMKSTIDEFSTPRLDPKAVEKEVFETICIILHERYPDLESITIDAEDALTLNLKLSQHDIHSKIEWRVSILSIYHHGQCFMIKFTPEGRP